MDEEGKRYVVLKASGSRYAYVNDTHLGKTVRRFDIFRRDGWAMAERMADRLNSELKAAQQRKGE